MVTKIEKFYIGISGMTVKSFTRNDSLDFGGAYASILLENCIEIDDVIIRLQNYSNSKKDGKKSITHNDCWSHAKTLDRPVLHLGVRCPKNYFSDYISMGLNEFLYGEKHDQICNFLVANQASLEDSCFYRPISWKKSLRIPVHFIRIYHIKGIHGKVIANIKIGHHITVQDVEIYPKFKPEGRIFNQKVIEIVENLLSKKIAKRRLQYYAGTNSSDWQEKGNLIAKASGCNYDKIPPIRFY